MTKKTEEKTAKDGYVSQERAKFLVAQRAALYNTRTQKYCIAHVTAASSFKMVHGDWDLFGGHIDADEMIPADAMKREIKEESGIDAQEVMALSAIDFTGYGKDPEARRILIGYLALCDTDEVTLSGEHDAFEWLTAQEIAEHAEAYQWVKDFVAQSEQKLKERDALGGWHRCLADFDNYKKRQAESGKESMQYAVQNMALSLIPVLDNFNASVEHVPAEHADSPWVMGLGYIKKQFEDALAERGVAEMAVAVGDAFDPMKHEAVKDNTTEGEEGTETEDDAADEKIVKIVTRGYVMGEKVVRPARVVVK